MEQNGGQCHPTRLFGVNQPCDALHAKRHSAHSVMLESIRAEALRYKKTVYFTSSSISRAFSLLALIAFARIASTVGTGVATINI